MESIKAARKRAGLSLHDLAKRCGTSHVAIAKAEREGTDPRASTVAKIAAGLGVPVGELYGEGDLIGRKELLKRIRPLLDELIKQGEIHWGRTDPARLAAIGVLIGRAIKNIDERWKLPTRRDTSASNRKVTGGDEIDRKALDERLDYFRVQGEVHWANLDMPKIGKLAREVQGMVGDRLDPKGRAARSLASVLDVCGRPQRDDRSNLLDPGAVHGLAVIIDRELDGVISRNVSRGRKAKEGAALRRARKRYPKRYPVTKKVQAA